MYDGIWRTFSTFFQKFLLKLHDFVNILHRRKTRANVFKDFFDKNPAMAAERTVQQSIEQIKQKSDWWKRDGAAIGDWLKNQAWSDEAWPEYLEQYCCSLQSRKIPCTGSGAFNLQDLVLLLWILKYNLALISSDQILYDPYVTLWDILTSGLFHLNFSSLCYQSQVTSVLFKNEQIFKVPRH